MSGFLFRCFAILCCLLPSLCPAASGRRILFLGDSLSLGSFGKTIDAELRAAGHSVTTVVTGGATPYYWLKEFKTVSSDIGFWMKTPQSERRVQVCKAVPKLEDLIATHKPEVVMVQTGTNLYANLRSKRQTPKERVRTVEYLYDRMGQVAAAGGCTLYLITPPDAHEQRYPRDLQNQMRGIMTKAGNRYGRVFDSYKVTRYTDPYPKEDGIHYGPQQSEEWARKVLADAGAWLPKAAAPRVASTRTETIRRATVVKSADNTVEAELVLAAKSEFKAPSDIAYRNGLAIYEWQIVRVNRGAYLGKRIRIAHMVMQDRKVLQAADWPTGKRVSLAVVPLSTYPNLEKFETLDSLPDAPDLPIYTPRL
jgi:hypothetical protein